MIETSPHPIVRYLLLALLPVIALMIYTDGQKYDPGLLDFTKTEEDSSKFLRLFPQKVAGLDRMGSIGSFNKDNLFEHINGHAEYFISAGFKGLAVADYGPTESGSPDITVDIYDVGGGANAFGVLMDETSDNAQRVDVGFSGFLAPRMLTFMKGPYYVKITSFKDGLNLPAIGNELEKQMGNVETVIPQLEMFPKEGAVTGSIRFIKEAYRGLDFLNRVFEQDYSFESINFQAALIEGDSTYIAQVTGRLLGFLESEEIGYEQKSIDGKKYYIIKDPFEGNWAVIPSTVRTFFIYGTTDEHVVSSFTETEKTP